MKKLKKLNLKKIKIASMNSIYSLRGGETEVCMSNVCDTNICDTVTNSEAEICTTVTSCNTSITSRADSAGCMSGDGNNNVGTQQSIDIC